MQLTKRGQKVVGIAFILAMLGFIALGGRIDAMDQCAAFQADNNYTAAIEAGCSLDMLPNGEYPYQWTPENR